MVDSITQRVIYTAMLAIVYCELRSETGMLFIQLRWRNLRRKSNCHWFWSDLFSHGFKAAMARAILVIENNPYYFIQQHDTNMHFPAISVVHPLNLIFPFLFFHSLSEFIKESFSLEIPMNTCPLIEQMCLNIQSSILTVIMANKSDTAKMEDFLRTCLWC